MQSDRQDRVLQLLSLPEEVVELVLLRLPLTQRVRTVPLVCRQLNALCKTSRRLFAQLVLPRTISVLNHASELRLESFIRYLHPI